MRHEQNFVRSQGVIATRPFHDLITKQVEERNQPTDDASTKSLSAQESLPLPSDSLKQLPTRRGGASKR